MRFSSLVVALSMLVSSPPAAIADPLSAEQELFVTVTLASLVVPIKCDGYEMIGGGLRRFGDAAGVVDGDRLIRAVIAAFSAANGGAYDRDDLVPEVTRKLNEVGVQIPKDGKFKSFCKKWGDMLIANHVAQRK
jgi:hypothetical protein